VSLHHRKIKQIVLDLGGTEYQCQLSAWNMANTSDEPEKLYSLCPDGESREEVDETWTLSLTFFSDWTAGGINDYLMLHGGETVAFQLDHHPDITGEHVRWTGEVLLKKPDVAGTARETETFEITLEVIGVPEYSRP
jgi:hypothetical protein